MLHPEATIINIILYCLFRKHLVMRKITLLLFLIAYNAIHSCTISDASITVAPTNIQDKSIDVFVGQNVESNFANKWVYLFEFDGDGSTIRVFVDTTNYYAF